MRVVILGAEPVHYDIKDKTTGKTDDVVGCKIAYAVYDGKGHCKDIQSVKATKGFCEWCSDNIGISLDNAEICYDKNGRASSLFDPNARPFTPLAK